MAILSDVSKCCAVWKISSTFARRSAQKQHLYSYTQEFLHGAHTTDTE